MKVTALCLALALAQAAPVSAQEREYRPGGAEFAAVWNKFYAGDHEPELDDPLISAGRRMTLVICEAIRNKNMRLRRYAIGALGYIGDRRALPALETIAKASDEIYYFRGDAIHAIYQIDRQRGKTLARRYAKDHEYLGRLARSIEKDEAWLIEPTKEE